jgi:hypothetical protein
MLVSPRRAPFSTDDQVIRPLLAFEVHAEQRFVDALESAYRLTNASRRSSSISNSRR